MIFKSNKKRLFHYYCLLSWRADVEAASKENIMNKRVSSIEDLKLHFSRDSWSQLSFTVANLKKFEKILLSAVGSKYSRVGLSKFVEDNFWKIFLRRSYHFKLFKDCLPQNLLSPLLNTLSHLLSDAYLGSCQTSMMEDKYPINKPIINIRPNPIKGSGTEVGFQQRCLMVSLLDFARCETWSIHYHFRNFFSDCTCNMISKWFSGMSYWKC